MRVGLIALLAVSLGGCKGKCDAFTNAPPASLCRDADAGTLSAVVYERLESGSCAVSQTDATLSFTLDGTSCGGNEPSRVPCDVSGLAPGGYQASTLRGEAAFSLPLTAGSGLSDCP